MSTTRAAIYARISRDTEGESLGVQRQIEACQQLADRMGFDVAETYVDNDMSAYKANRRPNYSRLLDDLRHGVFQAVIVWNLDRLLRQTKELETYLELCQPLNVATYEVTAGIMDLTSPSGRATAKTRGAWAQFESEHKSERIRAQKSQAAKMGKHLGGPAPFGWHRVEGWHDDQGRPHGGRFVPEPFQARMLAEGTDMMLKGHTLGDVARYWAAEGVRSGSGRTMTTTQIKRLLIRPRNAGLLTFHGETVSDDWPPVVSLDNFRALESMFSSPERKQQSEHKYKYLLSGIAYCHCGRIVHGVHARSKGYRVYRCTIGFEHGLDRTGHINRKMDPVNEYVTAIMTAYLRRPDVVESIRENLDRRRVQPVESESVADLNNRKNQLSRMFAQGQITEPQLIEGSAEVDGQLKEISGRLRAATGSPALAHLAVADDPGQAFLDAPVATQREALRTLIKVELRSAVSRKRDRPIDQEVIIHWTADESDNFPPPVVTSKGSKA